MTQRKFFSSAESSNRTQRSESNTNQYDILTIGDSSEDEEWGEMDASGRMFVLLHFEVFFFFNYEMSVI